MRQQSHAASRDVVVCGVRWGTGTVLCGINTDDDEERGVAAVYDLLGVYGCSARGLRL